MFFSNSFVSSAAAVHLCTMSHPNSPFPHKKKLQKYPPLSLNNSNNKLKKVLSGPSHAAESKNELGIELKDPSNVHSNSQKSKNPFNSISRSKRSNETIDELEIFEPNFNAKRPSMNGIRPDQTTQSNQGLERESNLVGMLGKQLYLAECRMQRMQTVMSTADNQLKDKDQEIGRLKRKAREWEAKFKNQEIIHKKDLQRERKKVEDLEHHYRRCLMLEHKIHEMEKFLADYGLVWIGESGKNHHTVETSPCNDYLKNCYTQLLANIDELNIAAGKGEVHVQRDKGGCGASFKTAPCMTLKFFKNGLVVQNGCLRPYHNPTTESFIRDILDGYFPSELQKAYPQGVPFKVEDHRTEAFQGPGCGFPGHGYRLGKVTPGEQDPRIGSGSVKSPGRNMAQLRNSHDPKSTVPLSVTSISKSVKSKSFSDPPALDLAELRSQIWASHNKNCSDSHIQSHINAELGLHSSRRDKKRELATREAEYHMPVREHTLKLDGGIRPGSQRFASGSRTSYHSSTDRSSNQTSPGLGRSRSRSSSLPGRRLRLRSLSKTGDSSGTDSLRVPKTCDHTIPNTAVKRPRATRSATIDRKAALVQAPLLHQVNDATGRPGELRLKVRSLNGSIVYLVHLCADDTVGRLYHLLDTCMTKARLRRYEVVVSGYAPKRLKQLGLSLREYGISRDSVLHVINDSAI